MSVFAFSAAMSIVVGENCGEALKAVLTCRKMLLGWQQKRKKKGEREGGQQWRFKGGESFSIRQTSHQF